MIAICPKLGCDKEAHPRIKICARFPKPRGEPRKKKAKTDGGDTESESATESASESAAKPGEEMKEGDEVEGSDAGMVVMGELPSERKPPVRGSEQLPIWIQSVGSKPSDFNTLFYFSNYTIINS